MRHEHVLRNASTGAAVATRVACARNPIARGIGLLNRGTVAANEGLWIDGCWAVHTIGMRARIDLYFVDQAGIVLRIAPSVAPQRLSVSCRGAHGVVELGASGGERPVRLGDRLVLE